MQRLTTGTLLSIDRDPDAIAVVKERLGKYPGSVVAMGNFCDMDKIALEHGIVNVDGVLLDIGVSSYQLDTAERGFSYHADAPLDMRMSQSGTSAADLVNTLSWQELAEIISRYGEDKSAVRIAKGIVKAREEKPIETTLERAGSGAPRGGTSGQKNVSGAAHCGKRRVGRAQEGAYGGVRAVKARRQAFRHHVPFA